MKKKKLLIYTSFPYWPRLETELEIADLHIEKSYEIVFVSCMGGLRTCPDNPKHRKLKCLSCTSRLKAGHRWIGKNRVRLERLHFVCLPQYEIVNYHPTSKVAS